jgi:hypothetical protein
MFKVTPITYRIFPWIVWVWIKPLIILIVRWRSVPIGRIILLIPSSTTLKTHRDMLMIKILFWIIVGIPPWSISFLLPRTRLTGINLINNLLCGLRFQHAWTTWFPPHIIHLVLSAFGMGHSLARNPWPLRLWHHTLCRSSVDWGPLGLLLVTLIDNFDNCFVKFHVALSCIAIIGSCCVVMLMVGWIHKGASKIRTTSVSAM